MRTRVGVLRGGPSREFEVSLNTGKEVINNLSEEKFDVGDVLIDRDGTWYVGGLPLEIEKIERKFDVLFNALHGTYGEDGGLQRVLDKISVPYTGSRKMGAALSANKLKSKEIYQRAGFKTPAFIEVQKVGDEIVIRRDGNTEKYYLMDLKPVSRDLFNTFPQPSVLKPVFGGSSINVRVVWGADELERELRGIFEKENHILIEERILGKEITSGVVDRFRNEEIYMLPPVEIVPKSSFFDYDSKYSGESQEICPARLEANLKDEVKQRAKDAHRLLGLRHYSRSDFIVTKKGSVYALETNSLPGLTKESLLPKSLESVGFSLPDFLEHVINLTLEGK